MAMATITVTASFLLVRDCEQADKEPGGIGKDYTGYSSSPLSHPGFWNAG